MSKLNSYLSQASIMQLALNDPPAAPYVVPVHPLYHDGAIYFYSVNTGRKYTLIKANPTVGFAINDFNGTGYRSVIGIARASFIKGADKGAIIKLLIQKYSGAASILRFSDDILSAVAVIKLEIISISFRMDRR